MYNAHAPPIEAKMTVVVRKCELSAISLRIENMFWWHVYAKTITGKAASAEMGPAHWKTRTGPRSAMVSPLRKCATTRMTRYAIENNAMTLVYFRESRRRRKDSGMTISLYSLALLL
jgi:arylamine N-acetyltransferase